MNKTQIKMESTKHLMIVWDSLHVIGCVLFLLSPYTTCAFCVISGLFWKKEFKIVKMICFLAFWWYLITLRSTILGIFSTIFLFYVSPRVFHEAISRLLPIHAIWYLNLLYPTPKPLNKYSTSENNPYSLKQNNSNDNNNANNNVIDDNNDENSNNNDKIDAHPRVSIILCNMNESIETMKINIDSIVKSKKFAEKMLKIKHIRFVLSDGGSKNIEDIKKEFGHVFDLISIIPGGKLRGRHVATLNEPSDIIVAYDSDRNYDIQNTYMHLQPYIQKIRESNEDSEKEDSAGVVGTTHYVNSDGTLPFNGGNSSYLRSVYLDNPFDITIREAKWIWQEEEIDWRDKLAKCGKVSSVDANYEDIDPVPLMACVKRVLNLKNSFGGGNNRSEINEDNFQIGLKVASILFVNSLISCVL